MKKLMIIGLILAASAVSAQSWTDNDGPQQQAAVPAPQVSRGSLTTYPTLVDFQNAVTASVTEDFSNTLVPGGGVGNCGVVINNATANACFNAGAVVAGFNVETTTTTDTVLLATGFNGLTVNATGASTFADVTQLSFDANDVLAVAFQAYAGLSAADVTVTAFDGSDAVIGSFVLAGIGVLPDSQFAGFSSPVPISRVTVEASGGSGDLISDLIFGTTVPQGPPPAVDALSTPGTALLLLSLLVMGALMARRF